MITSVGSEAVPGPSWMVGVNAMFELKFVPRRQQQRGEGPNDRFASLFINKPQVIETQSISSCNRLIHPA